VLAWRLLGLLAIGLGMITLRGCERYAQEYHTLPQVDFVESLPWVSMAESVPAASDLAFGIGTVASSLPLRQDVEPYVPQVAPPGRNQRTASGVRDAARVTFGTTPNMPGARDQQTTLIFSVIVFYSDLRANAWFELLTREMDIRNPDTGALQLRSSGPEAGSKRVWITLPHEALTGTGEASVIGTRGPVLYQLRVQLHRSDATSQEALLDLASQAEVLARQTAAGWEGWLAAPPGALASV
jgi:hypothetical protein